MIEGWKVHCLTYQLDRFGQPVTGSFANLPSISRILPIPYLPIEIPSTTIIDSDDITLLHLMVRLYYCNSTCQPLCHTLGPKSSPLPYSVASDLPPHCPSPHKWIRWYSSTRSCSTTYSPIQALVKPSDDLKPPTLSHFLADGADTITHLSPPSQFAHVDSQHSSSQIRVGNGTFPSRRALFR